LSGWREGFGNGICFSARHPKRYGTQCNSSTGKRFVPAERSFSLEDGPQQSSVRATQNLNLSLESGMEPFSLFVLDNDERLAQAQLLDRREKNLLRLVGARNGPRGLLSEVASLFYVARASTTNFRFRGSPPLLSCSSCARLDFGW
jgi:hypothetical protein